MYIQIYINIWKYIYIYIYIYIYMNKFIMRNMHTLITFSISSCTSPVVSRLRCLIYARKFLGKANCGKVLNTELSFYYDRLVRIAIVCLK